MQEGHERILFLTGGPGLVIALIASRSASIGEHFR
jgi:hypothetical protein